MGSALMITVVLGAVQEDGAVGEGGGLEGSGGGLRDSAGDSSAGDSKDTCETGAALILSTLRATTNPHLAMAAPSRPHLLLLVSALLRPQ